MSDRLSGRRITNNRSTAVFPPGASLDPGRTIWCTKTAAEFRRK